MVVETLLTPVKNQSQMTAQIQHSPMMISHSHAWVAGKETSWSYIPQLHFTVTKKREIMCHVFAIKVRFKVAR